MINPMEMKGKTIIVTGASSGIGRETAILISRLGGNVVLIARNEERLRQTKNQLDYGNHSYYSFDLLNHGGIEDLVKRIIEENDTVNGLAYCAGIGNRCPGRMLKPDNLIKMLKINTIGFVEIARVLSSTKYRKATASFVCVSSIASIKGEKGLLAYSMSKGAINSGMRVMAKELGSYGVRVNAVLPSWIKTEMADNIFEDYGKGEFDKEMDSMQYLGMGEPVDVANAIVFLLSDAAKFITGTEMIVDGGYIS